MNPFWTKVAKQAALRYGIPYLKKKAKQLGAWWARRKEKKGRV